MASCTCETYQPRRIKTLVGSPMMVCRDCGREPPVDTFLITKNGSMLLGIRKNGREICWVLPGSNALISIPRDQIKRCVIKGIKYAP